MSEHTHTHAHSHAEGNIRAAFFLNLLFVIIEVAGGLWTNSIAILSDAIHDFGDCLSIGGAMFLERVAQREPNDEYTYGYRRYSLVSALLTSLMLVAGSVVVVYSAIRRILVPEEVEATGMILIAVAGIVINGGAVLKTFRGRSFNERVISLHMLEDVLGWAVVLLGSVIIRLTGWRLLDPILSIGVALWLLYHAVRNMLEVMSVLLERTPRGFDMEGYRAKLAAIDGVSGLHHIHVWTMDGESYLSTLHLVVPDVLDGVRISVLKRRVREVSETMGIHHLTIQVDTPCDACLEEHCTLCEPEGHAGGYRHHQ